MPIEGQFLPFQRLQGEDLTRKFISSGSGNDSYTKLLLHMNGTDASTTFTDSSASAHSVTANGNAQIDTAQSKFGGASGLFDGTGDYLSLDGSSDFTFGTGDFTIDFWARPHVVNINMNIYDPRTASGELSPVIFFASDGTIRYFTNGAAQISGGTLTIDTWTHVALVKSSGSTKLYQDGTQFGSSYSDSNNYIAPASGRPWIGTRSTSAGNDYNGWLDEYRVSKGIARWTSNFTPPTQAYS